MLLDKCFICDEALTVYRTKASLNEAFVFFFLKGFAVFDQIGADVAS